MSDNKTSYQKLKVYQQKYQQKVTSLNMKFNTENEKDMEILGYFWDLSKELNLSRKDTFIYLINQYKLSKG